MSGKIKEKKIKLFGKDGKRNIPKTVQDSIPYKMCYENGVIKLDNNTYCKTYVFNDINFNDKEEVSQYEISDRWGQFLNLFSPQMNIQLTLFNRQIDESVVLNEVLIKPRPDNYNGLREASNKIIQDAMLDGTNNLKCEKYFTVSFKAHSLSEAMKMFRSIDHSIQRTFERIDANTHIEPLPIDKKLSMLYDIYNPYDSLSFERKYQNSSGFSLESLKKAGWKTKDAIGCPMLKFEKNHIELGDGKVARVFYITNFPEVLSSDFVTDIAKRDCSAITSLYFKPLDTREITKKLKFKLTDINRNLTNAQKEASRSGYSAELVSVDLQRIQESGTEFLRDMARNGQKNFLLTMQVILFANDLAELDEKTENLQSTVAKYVCDVRSCRGQEEMAFNSALPFANMKIEVDSLVQTDSASIFIPFSSRDIIQKDGIYLGRNQVSDNIIRVNKNYLVNMNKAFLGTSGSGKSTQAKWEIVQTMLGTNDDVLIIDPDNEYLKIAAMFPDDSEVIRFKPGAQYYINPLDLDISDEEDGSPISTKSSFIYGLMATIFGENYVLSPVQKSILNKCTTKLYEPYIEHLKQRSLEEGREITIDYEAAPTLVELYDMLMNMGIPEAVEMGTTLEMYCTGDNAIFAKRTNINPKKRMIVYDVKDLGILKDLGIYICNYNAWMKTIQNKRLKKNTNIYIDEFHVFMRMPEALADVANMYARARKFGGSMAVITQNVSQFFQREDALRILNNASMLFLLKQGDYEREKLAELFNLSDNEKMYMSNSPCGTGIIRIDENIYPFENIIPQDSELYEPLNTKVKNEIV